MQANTDIRLFSMGGLLGYIILEATGWKIQFVCNTLFMHGEIPTSL
jgi:hypothetical protein